jgi:hypothetical protein
MKELIASLDNLAENLEYSGLIKEAEAIDVFSNTFEAMGKEAFLPFKKDPKKKPEMTINTKEPFVPFTEEEERKHSDGAQDMRRYMNNIKVEYENIMGYLSRYKYMLEGSSPFLQDLGKNFLEETKKNLDELRKAMIGMKEKLRVLEPNKGGLS